MTKCWDKIRFVSENGNVKEIPKIYHLLLGEQGLQRSKLSFHPLNLSYLSR